MHVPVTGPSEGVITGVPQADVTVALPSAALMSVADGLHPGSVTSEYVPVNVGGLGAVAHVTILDVVAVLPQASIAVNVLV